MKHTAIYVCLIEYNSERIHLNKIVLRALKINGSLFNYRTIFLGQGGDIVAFFTLHTNHVISKLRRSSRKVVVHVISLLIYRAIKGWIFNSDNCLMRIRC